MTYKEKLKIILSAIREAQKVAIGDQPVKLYPSKENQLSDINPQELHDFLLKLQEDEKVIVVRDIPTQLKQINEREILENKTYFHIEILDRYGSWQSGLLIKEKAKLENLSKTNFNNIAHILFLIEEQIELFQSEKVTIHFVASIYEIEGYDRNDIDDLIETYTGGLEYLKNFEVVKNFTTGAIELFSEVTLDIPNFFDALERVKKIQKRVSIPKAQIQPLEPTKENKKTKSSVVWLDDFKWEGNNFVFGKYGSIPLQSKDRKHLFKALTDKRGNWASINELKGDKDAGYVRSTIKQIEDRFSEEIKNHIEIVSTQDDDGIEKPTTGAYRIKVQL